MNDRLCHTDIHMQRNDWGVSNYPVVLGHEGKERDFIYEFLYLLSYVKYLRLTMMILTRYHIHIFAMAIGVGIITKIGSSVKNLQIGDRVGKKDSSWINSQVSIC